MGDSRTTISPSELRDLIGTPACPALFDVRRAAAFDEADSVIPTARWRDHRRADDWGLALSGEREVVVYCVHGHQVSQSAAALLRGLGLQARFLAGGIEGYRALLAPLLARQALATLPEIGGSRWVAPARPGADGVAQFWLVRRFLDPHAAIYTVDSDWLEDCAAELEAAVIGRPGAPGLDSLIEAFGLEDAALSRLAATLEQTERTAEDPPGLAVLLKGLSANEPDDRVLAERALDLFDALFAWCRGQEAPTGRSLGEAA